MDVELWNSQIRRAENKEKQSTPKMSLTLTETNLNFWQTRNSRFFPTSSHQGFEILKSVYKFCVVAVTNFYRLYVSNTHIYSFLALEVTSPNHFHWVKNQGINASSVSPRENFGSMIPPASGDYWHSLAFGHITPIFKANIVKSSYCLLFCVCLS